MINKNKFGLVLLLIMTFAAFTNADIPPDPDEMRMTSEFIVETNEDLSDFRFFLDFSGAIHEIEIKSKSRTAIPTPGGGARYNGGSILAIPKTSLKDYPEKLENSYKDKGKDLSELIGKRQIEGLTELGQHRFSAIIKNSERKNWTYPTYRIEKEGKSLKLVKLNDISPKISLEEEAKINGNSYLALILGGIFLTFAIFIIGFWAFRKVLKKS